MRTSVFLIILSIAGCSSAPYSMNRPTSDRFASLTMSSRPGAEVWKSYHGIGSVDGRSIPKVLNSTIYVLEGERVIGYLCPGWLSTDAGPTITFVFKASEMYTLDCSATPTIRASGAMKRDVAGESL